MNINKIFFNVIEEQNILKTTKTKPIVDAIKNRNMITFYYSGPQKPKKDSVKNGYRVRAEAVALGLSKRGNLIVRAWVQPPSVSKKGFAKHGWRTFIVGRMSNVEITDEIFNGKRPEYKEGSDNSMTTTYVTTNWGTTSDTKKVEKPLPTVTKPEPTKPPVSKVSDKPTEVVPKEPVKPEELPQPKPEEKPSELPQGSDNKDYDVKQKELYKTKQTDWVNKQKEVGGNVKPGQGTRERFKKEVEKELPKPETEKKPDTSPEEDIEGKNLQESLKRIKRLMFS
jgi:hypothetical protein